MKKSSFHGLIIFVSLSVLALLGFILTRDVNAQHQGHQMPKPKPAASPAASPKTETKTPGMPMPAASPSPQGSPQHQMHMPTPAASPAASPMGQMPGMESGMHMDMGPLMVMTEDGDMGIRVGSSDINVISMGEM